MFEKLMPRASPLWIGGLHPGLPCSSSETTYQLLAELAIGSWRIHPHKKDCQLLSHYCNYFAFI
jgi:hypothetical protein